MSFFNEDFKILIAKLAESEILDIFKINYDISRQKERIMEYLKVSKIANSWCTGKINL